MLINIDPLLSPELLSLMQSMGHGDNLVLCDANFPAHSNNSKVVRLDGIDIPRAAKAILSVFPLDSFIPHPVLRMEIDEKPDEIHFYDDQVKNINRVRAEFADDEENDLFLYGPGHFHGNKVSADVPTEEHLTLPERWLRIAGLIK